MLLSGMTTCEIREYLSRRKTVLVPLGSTEQHGGLAPVDCDTVVAGSVCAGAAEACGAVSAPPLPYGYSDSHLAFAGTVSLSSFALSVAVEDFVRSLYGEGFRNILFLSGHGGNRSPVMTGIERVGRECPGARLLYMGYWDIPGALEEEVRVFGKPTGYHASAVEVSIYMHLRPEFTPDPSAMRRYPPSPLPGEHLDAHEWRSRYPDGPAGVDAGLIDPEKGREYLGFLVAGLAGFVRAWEPEDGSDGSGGKPDA